MEASFARADAEMRKHIEKQQKREREASAKKPVAAAPPKKTHKIIATRDRREMFKSARIAREAAEGEGEPAEEQLVVRRVDNSTCDYATAVEDIQIFLQQHGSEATLDEVRMGVGIDLLQPGLLDALRVNPKIEAVSVATGERLKYRPPYGVRNRGSLAHMLSRAFPEAERDATVEAEAVLRSELVAEETYHGVDVDVDELLAQGRCVRVERTDKAKAADYVLFAAVAGRPATEEVRALWHAERLPPGDAKGLEEELIKRKLRTRDELEARAARKKAANEKARAAIESNKKNGNVGRIRTWANTHLGDAAQLEELTHR
jgi:hypothetical protein